MKDIHFLLVDDVHLYNKLLVKILRNIGYEKFDIAQDAINALEILGIGDEGQGINEKEGIDIILTDLMMPGLSGIELCRRIRQVKKYHNTPIIMITSSNDISNLEEAFSAGVTDYITKPFNSFEVVIRIKAALRLKEEMDKRLNREKMLNIINQNMIDDLNVAVQLQRQMLPEYIIERQISIRGIYLPIDFLGGDLYYWKKLDKNSYGVILLDVMGHGTATSMICISIRSYLQHIMTKDNNTVEVIKSLNKFMNDFNSQLSQSEYYCTVFYTIVDILNKKIEYVNAGHPPALLRNGQQTIRLDKGCPPVGLFNRISVEPDVLEYGDKAHVFMFTDGILELYKRQNESKQAQLMAVFNQIYENDVQDNCIFTDKLLKIIEDTPHDDDISVVHIELKY